MVMQALHEGWLPTITDTSSATCANAVSNRLMELLESLPVDAQIDAVLKAEVKGGCPLDQLLKIEEDYILTGSFL